MKTQERDRVIVRPNEGKNDEELRWEKERKREGMKITTHDFLLVWTKHEKKKIIHWMWRDIIAQFPRWRRHIELKVRPFAHEFYRNSTRKLLINLFFGVTIDLPYSRVNFFEQRNVNRKRRLMEEKQNQKIREIQRLRKVLGIIFTNIIYALYETSWNFINVAIYADSYICDYY